eukprot:TRINITY_DN2620_c1_g2_i1.p1 TRINITY_DN2620_c1_g2~~TRINITY_DN2620_c1_g2_i1.p1  ORF type:complete len:326 (+),score=117.77 TRINITY_DN2620_c1_g2_i1:162-1139(+)
MFPFRSLLCRSAPFASSVFRSSSSFVTPQLLLSTVASSSSSSVEVKRQPISSPIVLSPAAFTFKQQQKSLSSSSSSSASSSSSVSSSPKTTVSASTLVSDAKTRWQQALIVSPRVTNYMRYLNRKAIRKLRKGPIKSRTIEMFDDVEVRVDGNVISVRGKLGEASYVCTRATRLELKPAERIIVVHPVSSHPWARMMVPTTTTMIENHVFGVSLGWQKRVRMEGVGYKAQIIDKDKRKQLELRVGFTHPVFYDIPAEVKLTLPNKTDILIEGCDKYWVTKVAGDLRSIRKPNVYTGKGIRYADEVLKLKQGKKKGSAKSAAGEKK